MRKQNGEINFFRFILAVIVMISHFEDNYKFGYFRQGYIGVEFYFLVTGYLMAKHAARLRESLHGHIADETWKFVVRKIRSFYKYYLSVIVLWVLLMCMWLRKWSLTAIIQYILRSIPQLTLTFMGLCYDTEVYVANTWYLSTMIIAIFILYPLLLNNFESCSKIVFPVVSVFILSYLYKTYNSICQTTQWNGFFYVGVLRAIAEIAFGVSLYQLSTYLTKEYAWLLESEKILPKTILSAIKWGCYGVVLLYAYGLNIGGAFSIHALLYFAIAITLSFSNAGYTIPDGKATRYLGKIALPIYIYHGLFRYMCRKITGAVAIPAREVILMLVLSLILAVLLMYVTDYIADRFSKMCSKFKERVTENTACVE